MSEISEEDLAKLNAAVDYVTDVLLGQFRAPLREAFYYVAVEGTLPRKPPQDVGPALREARKRHGLTLKQLSARCGVSLSHLSEIERGKIDPSVGMVERIVNVYGMTAHFECVRKEQPL